MCHDEPGRFNVYLWNAKNVIVGSLEDATEFESFVAIERFVRIFSNDFVDDHLVEGDVRTGRRNSAMQPHGY